MSTSAVRRDLLVRLAAEGVLPVLDGCAGALQGDAASGQPVEKAINYFGGSVVQRWAQWLRDQPTAARQAALVELANVTPEEAGREAAAALEQLAPAATAADRQAAVAYLAAIPHAVQRSLVSAPASGGKVLTVPPGLSLDDARTLIRLLPTDAPPYAAPAPLPGTDYQLEELIGSGGFGAVYRASNPSLQYLPLAIKLCLDTSLLPSLRQERSNLERLMKAGGAAWSPRVVRLYGYNLEHATPFLVYEYVQGGDLVHWLAARQARNGRRLTPVEVLPLIRQVAEGLAFAHERGIVHRDLKPANVLLGERTLKLADFGIGAVSRQSAQSSRIGTVASSQLSMLEQVSLYRGAGTPLYMSVEQRHGAAADPRHDLYSLGVMWFQLLVGDVSREIHPGWASELAEKFQAPPEQIALIERCVGWIEKRPADAGELLRLLRDTRASNTPPVQTAEEPPVLTATAAAPPSAVPILEGEQVRAVRPVRPPPTAQAAVPASREEGGSRHLRLVARAKQLLACHRHATSYQGVARARLQAVGLGLVGGILGGLLLGLLAVEMRRAAPPLFGTFGGVSLWCLIFFWIRGWQLRSRRNREERLGVAVDGNPKWTTLKAVLLALPVGIVGGVLFDVWLESEIYYGPGYDSKSGYSYGHYYYGSMGPLAGSVSGLLILAFLIRLRLRLWEKGSDQAREDLSVKMQEMLQEFPGECRGWGGQPSLSDPTVVEEIVRKLEAGRAKAVP